MADDLDKAIEEIRKIILEKKGKLFIDFLDDLNKKKVIQPVDNDEEEAKEDNAPRILTRTVIDEIIGGGIPEGKSALLYGEYASGKTQTCKTVVALCPNRVVYIDPEDSFSFKRLREICESRGIDYKTVKKKLILYKPNNWVEQLLIVHSIPAPEEIDGKIDLIVCDSLSVFFRGIEFYGRNTLPLKTGLLREFILGLKQVAKSHHAAILLTSQISEKPDAKFMTSSSDLQNPIGGHSVMHQPDFMLHFRKGAGNIRVVRMMDSSYNPLAERPFVLTKKGIEDLPKDAKKAKAYEQYGKKFDTRQQQEDIKSKSKGKTKEVANAILDAEPTSDEE